MLSLFPPVALNQSYRLQVSDIHNLYIEESGNPNGYPVLFIHGGPGGGCSPEHRRFFDPQKYRIILFDQRGCGQSTPHAELTDNTTHHLIADIEAIRDLLNVDKWLVFGGSWGSTLALLYAQAHPEQVSGLILRGIFLCRPRDIDWFYQQGASFLFPDYWEDYLAPIPNDKRTNLVQSYYQQLTAPHKEDQIAAAKAWTLWEGRCSTLKPNADLEAHFSDPDFAIAMARIECHYFINHAFLQPDQILSDCNKIQDIPTVIVQGRYDCVCPIDQAWALSKALPHAELHIIADAGHSAFEPGITAQLIQATNQFNTSES